MKKIYSPEQLFSDLARIDATISAANAEKLAIMEEVKTVALDAWSRIPRTFEWRVTWHSPRVMSVEMKEDDDYMASVGEWKARFPGVSRPGFDNGSDGKWKGMKYFLIGTTIVSTGGGHVILKLNATWHDKEPQDLTQEQADAFRAGVVPEELKANWGKSK